MGIRKCVRQYFLPKALENLLYAFCIVGWWRGQLILDRRWNTLPDRSLPHGPYILQHFVQHVMSMAFEGRPVGRIEAFRRVVDAATGDLIHGPYHKRLQELGIGLRKMRPCCRKYQSRCLRVRFQSDIGWIAATKPRHAPTLPVRYLQRCGFTDAVGGLVPSESRRGLVMNETIDGCVAAAAVLFACVASHPI
jgi:hypothetical protein